MTPAVPAARPKIPWTWRGARPGRLVWLELRRNPMLWLVPLFGALFWFAVYRACLANPPLWVLRAATIQSNALLTFAPLLAGVAAWSGSREGRRHLTDLVSVTALPRWAAHLARWAATTAWAEAMFLGGTAVVYGITAHQATWGGPLWWPVAVGAVGIAAACAVGYAAGAVVPGRFTAPLAAVLVFVALGAGGLWIERNATFAQIWPLNVQGPFPGDSYGVFYPFLPDLAIAQIMLLGGITAAALGALGLTRARGGPWLRGLAAGLTVAGVAAAATAVGLTGTARIEAHGIVIPALHDAARDRPASYTPVCTRSAVPVCLHPAYRALLPDVTAALGPVLDEIAGLPGAPVRVTQVAVTSALPAPQNGINFGGPVLSGHPATLLLPLSGLPLAGEGSTTAAQFSQQLRVQDAPPILDALVGLPAPQALSMAPSGAVNVPPGQSPGAAAQRAIVLAMATAAGVESGQGQGSGRASPVPGGGAGHSAQPAGGQTAAAKRFAALPATARHAWLVTHLAALRAGRITLSEIP
jgi:hypothetical protein